MFQLARRLRTDRRGQALVEYALLVCLIGACFVAILGLVGDAVKGSYRRSVAGLSGAESHGGGGGGGTASPAPSGGGWSASTVGRPSPGQPSQPDNSSADSTGAAPDDSSATGPAKSS